MGLSNIPQHARTQKPIPPAGIHPAICYAIIDMGVHQEAFKGNPPRNVQKLKMCFEFPTLPEQVFNEEKGPQRLSIMQDYNVSTGDKATLMKMLKQWRGVDTIDLAQDLKAYLGAPCNILVKHMTKDGITYANIEGSGLMVLPHSQQLGATKNPLVFFDTDSFSWPAFHSLWKFVQDKLRSSVDWPNILAKHGPEPVNPNAQQGQSFAQMGNVNQPVQQQVYQQPVQQMQQPVYNQQPVMQPNTQFQQQAPQFQQQQVLPPAQQQQFQQPQVNQVPQFHSGHNPAMGQSGMNTQQFQPNVVPQGTGIIVDDGKPPVF